MELCDTVGEPIAGLPFLFELSENLINCFFNPKEVLSHLFVLFAAIEELLLVVPLLVGLQNTPLNLQFSDLLVSLTQVLPDLL